MVELDPCARLGPAGNNTILLGHTTLRAALSFYTVRPFGFLCYSVKMHNNILLTPPHVSYITHSVAGLASAANALKKKKKNGGWVTLVKLVILLR